MATWWELTFTGEPTEADFRRVAEMAAQGFTSGQLINEPRAELEEGPATGVWTRGDEYRQIHGWAHEHHHAGQSFQHTHEGGDEEHGYYEHPEDVRP